MLTLKSFYFLVDLRWFFQRFCILYLNMVHFDFFDRTLLVNKNVKNCGKFISFLKRWIQIWFKIVIYEKLKCKKRFLKMSLLKKFHSRWIYGGFYFYFFRKRVLIRLFWDNSVLMHLQVQFSSFKVLNWSSTAAAKATAKPDERWRIFQFIITLLMAQEDLLWSINLCSICNVVEIMFSINMMYSGPLFYLLIKHVVFPLAIFISYFSI